MSLAVFVIHAVTDMCGTYLARLTCSVIFFFLPSGLRVFGQLYPEHLVGSVPTLRCHRCYRPVAALQRGGKAVQGRRPPLPHRLLAALQEDTADHPAGKLCELNSETWVGLLEHREGCYLVFYILFHHLSTPVSSARRKDEHRLPTAN